jgi:hypothetical protein
LSFIRVTSEKGQKKLSAHGKRDLAGGAGQGLYRLKNGSISLFYCRKSGLVVFFRGDILLRD